MPELPPTTFAGESEHFRLFVDDDVDVPEHLAGAAGLVALETHWTDLHTMLPTGEGKVDYYSLTTEHIAGACQDQPNIKACTSEDRVEIYAPTLPHDHELNHAYAHLATKRTAIPFLGEGLAESLGCADHRPASFGSAPRWPDLVSATSAHPDLKNEAGIFVRYLMRDYGVEAFMRYYAQSPSRRDPALFVSNFEASGGCRSTRSGARCTPCRRDGPSTTGRSALVRCRRCRQAGPCRTIARDIRIGPSRPRTNGSR